MGGMTIRTVESEDFDAVANLCNRIFSEVEDAYIPSVVMTPTQVGQDGPFFVAVTSHGRIVGCVQFRPNPGGPFSLAVDPAFRNQGIGRQLMITAEECAAQRGYRSVKTGIVSFRESELLPYYQKLGYYKTGKERPVLGEGCSHHLVEIRKDFAD